MSLNRRVQAFIRSHLKEKLLKYKSVASLPQKCPTLTASEMKKYEAFDGDGWFTPKNFHIDFVREWKRCQYNCEAREFAIDHTLETLAGADAGIPEMFLTREWVGRLLDAHIKTLRVEYKKHAKPQTERTRAKARARVLQKRAAARRSTVRHRQSPPYSLSLTRGYSCSKLESSPSSCTTCPTTPPCLLS